MPYCHYFGQPLFVSSSSVYNIHAANSPQCHQRPILSTIKAFQVRRTRCQPWRIQQTLCGIKAQWRNLIGNIYFSRKAVSYGLLVLVVQLYLHSSNHAAGITLLELYISITRKQGDDTYMKGKSTVACALSQGLHMRGKLTYILDGDNVRHGLNRDLSFKAEDRAENIRRIAEVARLFADAGIICIASLISPYRKDRDVCRALFPEGDFIEVFMDVPLHVCENRDPKGLYKLARAGKIKGFTGVDDPYEPPLNCEIVLQQKGRDCVPPGEMAETVISYLEEKGYLQA
ncbi:adenylyl-sulfate kinase 3 isoform X1 [Prunus dulcis]|uniref:adenylyl-sulfate kinase 3 isoform X1 n=1 Tax=Prunus dulcis TaxID=3755 RepID=UPI0014837FE8|nr:adenylyl-sulfate kinase 3 isoform X1 [Prunus dulcis]